MKLTAHLAPNNSTQPSPTELIQTYTYHRLTPNHPRTADGLSWRLPRFARRRSRARKQETEPRRRAFSFIVPRLPLADIPHSAFRQSPIQSRPALLASLEISPQIGAQIRVKSAQNRAPFAPNSSASAHNSIEFVPPYTSKTLEITVLRRMPAKLIPRLSFRFPNFSAGTKTEHTARVTWRLGGSSDFRPSLP
jgi:hypothetical protein